MEVCKALKLRYLTPFTDTANPDTLITCIPNLWRNGGPNFNGMTVAAAEEDLVRGPFIERPGSLTPIYGPFMTPAIGGPNLIPDSSKHMQGHDQFDPIDEENAAPEPTHPRVSPPPPLTRRPVTKPRTADDPMNVQQRVLRHLKEISRDPMESIYDLAGLIATFCASAFDENQIPDDLQFLDFFEHSIGSVVRRVMIYNPWTI